MPRYEFSENNSGGSWWLNREQYEALFAAGWKYEPSEYDIQQGYDKEAFLGGDAPYAWRNSLFIESDSIEDAVRSWEEATGENFFAGGCPCCGPPFSISGEGDYYSGGYVEMGRPF
jgi:hypothetical protein